MVLAILLDVLVFVIPLLVIPLGLWLGAHRQIHIGAGILAASVLMTTWAGPWGDALSDLFDGDTGKASFAAATFFLFAGAIIGSLVAVATVTDPPSPDSQLIGGVIAWLNGLLFLSVGLTAFEQYWASGARPVILSRGVLAEFLAVHLGWVVFFVALIAAGFAIATLFVRRQMAWEEMSAERQRNELRSAADSPNRTVYPVRETERPVRIPREADGGKVEPVGRRHDAKRTRGGSARHSEAPREQSLRETLVNSMPINLTRGQFLPGSRDSSRGATEHRAAGGQQLPATYSQRSGQSLGAWLRYASGMTSQAEGETPPSDGTPNTPPIDQPQDEHGYGPNPRPNPPSS